MSTALITVLIAALGTAILGWIGFKLGFKAPETLGDEDSIWLSVIATYPGSRVDMVCVAKDRKSALVNTKDGQLILVKKVGDKSVTRKISSDMMAMALNGHAVIDVRDLGFPSFEFVADSSELAALMSRYAEAKSAGDVHEKETAK